MLARLGGGFGRRAHRQPEGVLAGSGRWLQDALPSVGRGPVGERAQLWA